MKQMFSSLLIFAVLLTISRGWTQPIETILFTKESFEQNRFLKVPVLDFDNPAAQPAYAPFGERFSEGLRIDLLPKQGSMYLWDQLISSPADSSLAIVLEYAILQGDPEVAVVALNAPNREPDNQLGYTQIVSHENSPKNQPLRTYTLYAPPSKTMLVGAQVSLTKETDQPASLVLYSITIYPFEQVVSEMQPTSPDGAFDAPSSDLPTNINGDTGEVQYNSQEQNIYLTNTETGQAANIALQLNSEIIKNEPGYLHAQTDVSLKSGDEGTSALVLTCDEWSTGIFTHNSNLSLDETATHAVSALLPPTQSDVSVVVQNGGGASSTSVDNVIVKTLMGSSLTGIRALPEASSPSNIAAALFVPQNLYRGSEASYSLTTIDGESRNPVSLPYRVILSNGQQNRVLHEGITNAKGFDSYTFSVPADLEGNWDIELQSFNQSLLRGQTQVQEGGVLFIEIDKPIYKPGQTLQGRVILLNNTLSPLQDEIELTINDAKGIKIHKETLSTNEYGVDSFELPLASELNFGTWKITAKSGTQVQVQKDVEVDQYVLPDFEVSVELEKDWFLPSEPINGSIESRYFFGKPVQGNVSISALRYVGDWEEYATASAELTEGRYTFELPPVQYTAGTPGAEGAGTLQLKVTVTDDAGQEESSDLLARIVNSGANLKLIPESNTIKPGLNQELVVVTDTQSGEPLSGLVSLDIQFMDENGRTIDSIEQQVETQNGLATVSFDVPEKTAMTTVNATSRIANYKEASHDLVLPAAYSPSGHFIHLRQQNSGVLQVGQQAVFDVFRTGRSTIFYEVRANGRTIFSSVSDSGQIRFPVTLEMSPKSRVIAYTIQENNEISADALPFEVELAASTDLQAEFNAEEVRPGDPVSLSLQSAGQSMIGLSIVDESVYALAEDRLNLRNVFAELERIFMEPKIEVHQNPNNRFEPIPELDRKGAADILKQNQIQVFTTRGLHVPEAESIDPWVFFGNPRFRDAVPVEMLPSPEEDTATGGQNKVDDYKEPDRVRTFFPETWLWRPDLLTDDSGQATLDLTAPDSITTWKLHALSTSPQGVGIAESSLRVFQDFFAEPDLPYSVIRGDRFPMRVALFNYVDEEQSIRVTLDETDGLGLQSEAVQEITLPGNGIGSVEFTLQPEKVGTIPISITAQSSSRADALRKDLKVIPEGVRQEIVHNGVIDSESPVSVPIAYPDDRVSDSASLRVSIVPSLVGQSMNGLDDLLGMPYGCGEQNMIFLAPDIEILRYLKATGSTMPAIQAKAEHFITVGYQRELTFQRNDGSFSAFGQQDDEGSLWLTSFVLGTFSRARELRTIDETVLADAAEWILDHQKDDGSWEPVGFLIHQELSGGLDGNLALTAFVALSLLDYGEANDTAVLQALNYLSDNLTNSESNSYILAMSAYALARADHPSTGRALDLLLQRANQDANGIYWEPHPIETTAYAALALMREQRMEAQPALSWIASQRNSLGGYGSTQDTVVALKALSQAASNQSRNLDATIDVQVDGESIHTFAVNSDNFDVLQTLELDPVDHINLEMSGEGRVSYQIAQGFNIPVRTMTPQQELQLDVEYSAEHVETDDIVDVNVSILYSGELMETGMSIVDVSVPTGFELVQESLERVRSMEIVKRIEQAGRKVIFYLDHLSTGETFEFSFQVKAKYPVEADAGVSAAYLYYQPEKRTQDQGPLMTIE